MIVAQNSQFKVSWIRESGVFVLYNGSYVQVDRWVRKSIRFVDDAIRFGECTLDDVMYGLEQAR